MTRAYTVRCRSCRLDLPAYYVGSLGVCIECYLAHWFTRRREIPPAVATAGVRPVLPPADPVLLGVLTARQRDVYARVLAGLSVAAIARADRTDARTIERTVARIRDRLAKNDRGDTDSKCIC